MPFHNVPNDEWPTFDIDPKELMDLMVDWDKYYEGAVLSLAEVRILSADT